MSTDDDTPDEGLPENLGEEVSEGTSLQEAVEQLRDEVDQPFDVLSESIKEYMVENTDLTTDEDLTVIVDVEEDDVAFTRGVGDGGLNVVFSGIDNEGE